MTIVDTGKTLFFRNRFCILFVLLLCVILIPSYFEDSVWIGKFWRGLFTLVLFWALYSVAGSQRILILAVIVLIPTAASTWLAEPGQQKYLAYVDNATNIVYFTLICYYLGRYIIATPRVTAEVIYAAMCLYIMIAVLWAAIYTNIELYYGGAFTFNGLQMAEAGITQGNLFIQMIYYSFVTLSTLGYGDVLPQHDVAQNWAGVEAMIGQFYIAIIMARLVSAYTVNQDRGSSKDESST